MTQHTDQVQTQQQRSARRIALVCVGVVGLMVGMAYAAVPLYDLFCRVTGYAGTTQRAEQASDRILERDVTIRFDSNVARDLPWKFKPSQGPITLKAGETGLAFYTARNDSDHPITGTATFNVSPQKAGAFFIKLDCFCFTEQTLQPGEEVDMPVTFFVDPDIEEEKYLTDVQEITLSYTFFPKKEGEDVADDQLAAVSE